MSYQVIKARGFFYHRYPWITLSDQTAETSGKVWKAPDGEIRRFVAWMSANLGTVTVALDDNSGRFCGWTLEEALSYAIMGVSNVVS
jgi:hypothetical protein